MSRPHQVQPEFTETPGKNKILKHTELVILTKKLAGKLDLAQLRSELLGIAELAGVDLTKKPEIRIPVQEIRRKATLRDLVPAQKPAGKKIFCPEFLEFLRSGDISALAPTGLMNKEMFDETHDYIFCNVQSVKGKTLSATFYSNPSKFCSGVMIEDFGAQPGPAVIVRKDKLIVGYINMKLFDTEESFSSLASEFNSLAAQSKGRA
jgi:hypothetical protein